LWNYALLTGNVVRVTLLWYLAPVWSTGLSLIVFRERLRPARLLTIVGGLAGAAILLGLEAGFRAPLAAADALAVVSSIIFSVLTIYIRKTGAEVGGWEKTFFAASIATVFALAAIALLPPIPVPTLPVLAGALPQLLLCMVWQLAVMWLFMWGSAYLESGRVAIYLLLEVVGAVVSASILTAEPFGWREIVGCLFIVGAGLLEGVDELRRGRRAVVIAAPAGRSAR
jgi:drug/metabolite transporter (DMT)-like permease